MRPSFRLAVVYGAIHALVDALTVTTAYAVFVKHHIDGSLAVTIVLTYDIIAFASQPILGALLDRTGHARDAAVSGTALCIIGALLIPAGPFVAAVVAGVGNALFHLGGGIIALSIRPGRAAAPGIFVGPGTLGLAFGIWYGRFADAAPLWLLVMSAVAGASLFFFEHPPTVSEQGISFRPDTKTLSRKLAFVAFVLLFVSIFFRSLVGHSAGRECPKTASVVFGLAAAGCIGKMCGGLLSDAVGWLRVSIAALIPAGFLIAFCGGNPILIAIGAGLFQMTMPVTLTALSVIAPNRPGTVFGLNCLAFVGGALPVFTGLAAPYYSEIAFLLTAFVGVTCVSVGLFAIRRRLPGGISL